MSPTPIDFAAALNPEQHAAATHGDGPQLVIAGAGSGKTRVITYRIAWLVRECGVDPREITAVTFTNKAAGEMKERVEQLVGVYPLTTFVGTFHRFALRMLRRWGDRVGVPRDFAILDTGDQKTLIKKAIAAAGLDESAFPPNSMLGAISGAKNRLESVAAYERKAQDFFRRRVATVYRGYQKLLLDASAIDFDDMIRFSVQLLESEEGVRDRVRGGARYLLVDEFQDTNHAQMRMIHGLVGTDGNLTAVGDEDQGIYRWRGAELDNILGFEDVFKDATVRKLERNYRSTQTILDASGAVVSKNQHRRGKQLWTDAGSGENIILYRARDEQDEAGWVARTAQQMEGELGYSGMAVLVRTNAQTRALEDAFLRRRIPYSLIGGVRFYERAEIKDLVAYLRLLRNPHDVLSFSRVLNKPTRGIGKTTQDAVFAHAEARNVSPWQLLLDGDLGSITERARRALVRFRDLMRGLAEDAQTMPLSSLLERLIEVTDYTSVYAKDDAENQAKRENIAEFVSAAQEFTERNAYGGPDDLLTAFLDHVSLVADIDGLEKGRGISVMTLHSAKGLEFPLVMLTGLEDGLLPHFNSQAQVEDLEEERRLLYVGMTRAEKRLYLTTCRRRRIAGRYQDQQPSPFLAEIPEQYLETEESAQLYEQPAAAFGRRQRREDFTASDVHRFFGNQSATLPTPAAVPAPKSTPVAPAEARDSAPPVGGQMAIPMPGASAPSPAVPAPAPVSRPSAPRPSAPRPSTPRSSAPASPGPSKSAGATVRKGTKVRHGKLGKGTIIKLEGEGDGLRVTVIFERIGKRKLLARYANLEVV